MATDLTPSPVLAPRAGVSLPSRIYGFGSVYAKSMRDSRLAFVIIAGLLSGLILYVGAGVSSAFETAAARQELARLATDLPPILQGMSGKPVNVDTLGGYMTFKYGSLLAVVASLWSILALSGSLASEARRGSLELLAAAPFGKRRLALEKLAAHLTLMAAAMALLAGAAWVAGAAFGTQPGDAIPLGAAAGYALYVGLLALASGSLAFALAPFLGRAPAASIAGFVMLAGWILSGYQSAVPAFSGVADLSWFSWTAEHLPLAGQYDWSSLLPVAATAAGLFVVGVEAFARRDLGASTSVRLPGLPNAFRGLHGPGGRSFAERLPMSLAWGLGLGVFGLVIAAASRSFAEEVTQMSPTVVKVFRDILPNFDLTSAGGFLQLLFVQFGFIVVGFAAATLVAGWASDETTARLEMLLATPLARLRWALSSGLGVYAAVVLMTLVLAVSVGIGAVIAGSDAVTPMLGSLTLGLYAAAAAGLGLAIGGLFRAAVSAQIVAAAVTVTFLIDLVAPALELPDWVHQLSLTAHMGQPMVGDWDAVGIVVSLVVAGAGLAAGAWGFARRDLKG